MIERALQNDTDLLKHFLIILFIVNVVMDWFLHIDHTCGYGLKNFVFLYCIGRYLHISSNSPFSVFLYRHSLLVYLISSITSFVLYVLLVKLGIVPVSIWYWGYNSPLILLSSVGMFLTCTKLKFRSTFINTLASGVVGVYFLHSGISYRKEITVWFFQNFGYLGIFLFACIILLITLPISVVIEKIIACSISTVTEKMQKHIN